MGCSRYVAALALLALGGVARAEAPGKGEGVAEALRRQNIAFQHLQRGDYAAGVAELEAAHAASPDPGFLYNLALAFDRWPGHCVDALLRFGKYLEDCPGCEAAAEARARQDALRTACLGELVVESRPAGAVITLDGTRLGPAPLRTRVVPGTHRLRAELAGHSPEDRAVTIASSARTPVNVTLRPSLAEAPLIAPAPPPRMAQVRNLGPWAWAGFGVGAAGLVLGAVSAAQGASARSDFAGLRDGADPASPSALRPQLEGLAEDAAGAETRLYLGAGVALAGIAAGVILLLLDDPAPAGAL